LNEFNSKPALVIIESVGLLSILCVALILWLVSGSFTVHPTAGCSFCGVVGAVTGFIAGLIIALGIALFTVSYRIVQAALINPAQSLRYE
jgi:hypothetical protein